MVLRVCFCSKGGPCLWVSGTQLPLFLVINCFKDSPHSETGTLPPTPSARKRAAGEKESQSDLLIRGSEEEGVVGFCCIAAHLSKTKHKEQQLKHGRNDMGWFGCAERSDGYPQIICPMMPVPSPAWLYTLI